MLAFPFNSFQQTIEIGLTTHSLNRSKLSHEGFNRDEKYHYYKNHFTPGEKHQLYQKNIMRKEQAFNLSFKYKWLADHPWHVYSKELSGDLCKACILFDKSTTNRRIFAKNVFQEISEPAKITEHAGLLYHLAAMVEAERFIKS